MYKKFVHLNRDPSVQLDPLKIRTWVDNREQISQGHQTKTMRNKFEGSKDVGEDKLIKIESVLNEGQLKTESARIQSAKTFDLQKPKSKIVVNQLNNEDDHMQFHGKTNNPRELQQKLDQKNFFEIFERGSNLYAKVHHEHDLEPNPLKTRVITIKTDKYEPQLKKDNKTQSTRLDSKKLSIGYPGVLLGHSNIHSKEISEDVRGKQALECILVAHGYYFIKSPPTWNEIIIDDILKVGSKLSHQHLKTSTSKVFESFTRCFQINNYQFEVTLSPPNCIGKIVSINEDVEDLELGLTRFFNKERIGVFRCPGLDLWIMKNKAFYVFDPRGRTLACNRSANGEASLIVLAKLENVCHLIRNLSSVNEKSPFKICKLKVKKLIKVDETNKNQKIGIENRNQAVDCERMRQLPRKCDFLMINDHKAILSGDLTYENLGGMKQSLNTCIMSIIYSKIDPPSSWSSNELNKVLVLGNRFYLECFEEEVIDINLEDLPSKIVIGDQYQVKYAIVPRLFEKKFQSTNLYFDHEICKGLRSVFSDTSINAVVVQLDAQYYSIWRSNRICYLFDGHAKNKYGDLSTNGMSCLLMTSTLEQMCEAFVERSMKLSFLSKTVTIHGFLIKSMEKLNKNKSSDKEEISLVDSLEILMPARKTAAQLTKVCDLNSASTLKPRDWEGIVSEQIQSKSMTAITVVHDIQLELIRGVITDLPEMIEKREDEDLAVKPFKTGFQVPPTILAEKVLLKSDLKYLEQQKNDIVNGQAQPKDCNPHLETIKLSLSRELLLFSCFKQLPDGTSQILRGTKNVEQIETQGKSLSGKSSLFLDNLETYEKVSKSTLYVVKNIQREIVEKATNPDRPAAVKNLRVISAISAILVSRKYSISSWTSDTIDKVLDTTQKLGSEINFPNEKIFYSMSVFHLPAVELNSKIYRVAMIPQESFFFENLETNLAKYFKYFSSFLLVSSNGSLAVFRHQNFYYLFEGAPCNIFGFRVHNSDEGLACLLRFVNLKSLVRRIQANHPEIRSKQKVVVFRLVLKEIKDNDGDAGKLGVIYKKYQKKEEESMLRMFKATKNADKRENRKQLRYVEKEMRKERNRMMDFPGCSNFEGSVSDPESSDDEDTKSDIASEKSLITMNSNVPATHHNQLIFDSPCGYQADSANKIKVIEGTFSLTHQEALNPVTACHFTSIYAIMFLVHNPISSFCYRTVDKILEKGIELHRALQVKILEEKLQIKNIIIDNISYELLVQIHSSYLHEKDLKEGLDEYFSQQNYLILREIDTCFAVYQDKQRKLHLFNSYGNTEQKAYWVLLDGVDELMQHLKAISIDDWSLSSIYTVNILDNKKIARVANVNRYCFSQNCDQFQDDNVIDEAIENVVDKVVWSRLNKSNLFKIRRGSNLAKWKDYDIEVENVLFSLWGNIHPNLKIFGKNAGKQHLAVCVISLLMASLYRVDEWTADLLDSIVVSGHRYFEECLTEITQENQEFTIKDLKQTFELNALMNLKIQPSVFGTLYNLDNSSLNLRRALQYFFLQKQNKYGILQCQNRFLAIGCDERQYFLFDCQETGFPLFTKNQGTVYVLRCCSLWALQLCIVQTLREKCHNIEFFLFSVKVQSS